MLQQLMTIIFYRHNYAIITLYILDRLEAPREYVLNGLDPGIDWTPCLLSSISVFLVCSGPPSILLFVPTTYVSHLNPPLPAGQLSTSVEVNNMTTLHHIYTVTYIYITFILLFIPFFILLPLLWAGRLAQTLLVCHTEPHHFWANLIWWDGPFKYAKSWWPFNSTELGDFVFSDFLYTFIRSSLTGSRWRWSVFSQATPRSWTNGSELSVIYTGTPSIFPPNWPPSC